MTEFKNTYNMFNEYIIANSYSTPMSYGAWVKLPKDLKAPALFVNFFDQITLAWNKLRTAAAVEEECVEETLQYLWKQVPILERDPKKFTKKYIYRIVSNCIYCRSIDPYDPNVGKNSWYNKTQSNRVIFDGDELDLFETMSSTPFASKISEADGWEHIDMSDVCVETARRIAFKRAGIWDAIFGKLDHVETTVRRRKIERDAVAVDVVNEVDKKVLLKELNKYGYSVVRRVGNAKYVISDSDEETKMTIDADRYNKPVFTSLEFIKEYCKGETKEEYEVDIDIYSGGMDAGTQLIVKYILGESVDITEAQKAKIPEVLESIRQLILANKDSFEFAGIDLTSNF